MPDPEDVDRQDIEALGATRAELGAAYEPALLDAFADKVEATIQRRVDGQLAMRGRDQGLERQHATLQFTLGVISMVAAIPISIVLGVTENFLALLVAWLGIIAVNLAHALRRR